MVVEVVPVVPVPVVAVVVVKATTRVHPLYESSREAIPPSVTSVPATDRAIVMVKNCGKRRR